MQWFAQVSGQIYGPYDDAQMQSFVSEGRITGQSMISNTPGSGFFQAVGYDVFSLWSGTGQVRRAGGGMAQTGHQIQNPAPHMQSRYMQPAQAEQSAPSTPAQTPDAAQAQCVIMAEIRSESLVTFLQRLQTFGHAERIGETVWILKTAHNVQALRNALSQSLTRQDRLFIVDSANNKTAWFNIGADLDSRIRNLWDDEF